MKLRNAGKAFVSVLAAAAVAVTHFGYSGIDISAYDLPETYDSTVTFSDTGTAAATSTDKVTVSGNVATITGTGKFMFTGTGSDGGIVVSENVKNAVVVMSELDLSGSTPLSVRKNATVTLCLSGDSNRLSGSSADMELISGAVLTVTGDGKLTADSTGTGISAEGSTSLVIGENAADNFTLDLTADNEGISSVGTVTVKGGTLTIDSDSGKGIAVAASGSAGGILNISGGAVTVSGGAPTGGYEAVSADKNVNMTGGTLSIDTQGTGIGGDSVSITSGTADITSGESGITATTVNIGTKDSTSGPTVTISSGDSAVSVKTLNLYSGKTDISTSMTALSGKVNISGGTHNVTAGTAVCGGCEQISVTGGKTELFGSSFNAGSGAAPGIYLSDGTLIVGSLDDSIPAPKTGRYIVFGTADEPVSFVSGDTLRILDVSGNEIYSTKASAMGEHLMLMSGALKFGRTYKLLVNGTEKAEAVPAADPSATFTLTFSAPVTVTRDGIPLATGAKVFTGDELVITAPAQSGKILKTLAVNNKPFTSGSKFTVEKANVAVKSEYVDATETAYRVYFPAEVTVTRDSIPLENEQLIYADDKLVISVAVPEGKEITEFTVNDGKFTSGKTYTVTNADVNVVAKFADKDADYKVTFMSSLTVTSGGKALKSGDTVKNGAVLSIAAVIPDGKGISSFKINGEEYEYGKTYTVDHTDVDIKVEFSAKDYAVIFPEGVTVKNGTAVLKSGDTVKSGTKLTVTAVIPEDKVLVSLTANGIDIQNGGIVPVTASDVEIKVEFADRSGDSSISGTVIGSGFSGTATLELLDTKGTKVADTIAANGRYSFPDLDSGSYTMRVSATGFVPREYTVTLSKNDLSINPELRKRGDAITSGTGSEGKIDQNDAVQILRYLIGTNSIFDSVDDDTRAYLLKVACVYLEVDPYATLSVLDASQILRYMLGQKCILNR
ncbi:MAG: carbohydrate-binding domain-containing protein [Ruminiclostridium sp.]|nr:carbohydrate-binding domain-containing protein [Ruminiclostridium sp.]